MTLFRHVLLREEDLGLVMVAGVDLHVGPGRVRAGVCLPLTVSALVSLHFSM